MNIDYKKLLRAYMKIIIVQESIALLNPVMGGTGIEDLSDAEIAELLRMEGEIFQERSPGATDAAPPTKLPR